jgi:hypothetical protein
LFFRLIHYVICRDLIKFFLSFFNISPLA